MNSAQILQPVDLELPVVCSQSHSGFFGKFDAHQILPWLWLGSVAGATDLLLHNYTLVHIDAVLSIGEPLPEHVKNNNSKLPRDYLFVPVDDEKGQDIVEVYETHAKGFLRKHKAKSHQVLVHCQAGISRSASVVIMYLMETYRMNFMRAYERVRIQRPFVKPIVHFVDSIVQRLSHCANASNKPTKPNQEVGFYVRWSECLDRKHVQRLLLLQQTATNGGATETTQEILHFVKQVETLTLQALDLNLLSTVEAKVLSLDLSPFLLETK